MSIFFEFDVGPTGRRFRRAVDADKFDIALFHKQEHTVPLFGEVDTGSLIELAVLSICLIDETKKVTGFISLSDHPNIPGVNPSEWEFWMRNMFQKYYLSRNTLFIHFMCCIDDVTSFFLEEALVAIFLNDIYLQHIVIIVPPGCPTSVIMRYKTFGNRSILKLSAKKDDDSYDSNNYMYVAARAEFVPKLKIRRAVEEDNDDIIEILDNKCPELKELYGDYYISEIIGQHPEGRRKIIVAEFQEHAIGLMCLNPNVNYNMLQNTYELQPYHGLIKATCLEKEESKRKNTVLKAFGEPIITGKWSPFHSLKKLEQLDTHGQYEEPKEKYIPVRRKSSKIALTHVNFNADASMRRSFDQLLFRQHHSDSDLEAEKVQRTTPLLSWTETVTTTLLDEDPFEYDIINIESKLFAIPEPLSFERDSILFKPQTKSSPPSSVQSCAGTTRRRKSSSSTPCLWNADNLWNKSFSMMIGYPVLDVTEKKNSTLHCHIRALSQTMKAEEIVTTNYTGESNAFIIELFGLRDDFDQRRAFDLLEAAFEVMKPMDYCIIRVPCVEKAFPLLQHFCFVPSKNNVCSQYALYIAHRSSVLGKLRVRKAELFDIPQIAIFLHNIDSRETVWTIESCIVNKQHHTAYVFMSGMSLVGVGIVEPPDQIDFIRAKFDIDAYHNHKYHYKGHGHFAGFCNLTAALVYPVFEVHFRFFMRELMRLTDSQCLLWLTAYRNKLVAHKANTMASAMIPIKPRKSEIDCVRVPEHRAFTTIAKDIMAFSTWFLNKRLTSVSKVNIDTRIVIVGASMTAMGFLDNLLFNCAKSYLTFTNVTLISKHGLSYVRNTKTSAQRMFLKFRTDSDKYLKSVPYTYYVNVVQGKMVEINKKMKFVKLQNGSRYDYDMLFLLFGKQYQHPDYLKVVFEREKDIKLGNIPRYIPVDVSRQSTMEYDIFNIDIPTNVFLVNDIAIANKALNYVHHIEWIDSNYKIIVYGETIHAYCCLDALLDDGVQAEHLIFIEPFPSENPKRARIPVFCNVYVDQTLQEVLKNSAVTVYRSYYFESWTVNESGLVTHVDFVSDFHRLRLECSALFYYGKRGVDLSAFVALSKSGMAYDGGILIDHHFRTKDPYIYAAGTSTRYLRKYYADSKRQKYYDSYEVGEKLGTKIRNQLDPLWTEKNHSGQESDQYKKNRFPSTLPPVGSKIDESSSHTSYKPPEGKLPEFKNPVVIHCNLPGNLQYLEVRPAGKKIPHYYVQTLQFNGFVMETFKKGYFKLHLNEDLFVDGITCLTTEKFNLDNFKNLYGLSAVVLNNVHMRYGAKKIDNFFSFFRSPWAFFLYHEHRDELFATIKEILPKGLSVADTLKEALTSVTTKLSDPSYKQATRFHMRNSFEKSPYVESIAAFVIEWLSENEILLPMYMQPWQKSEFQHDLRRNPIFRRRKHRIKHMLAQVQE